MREYNQRRKYGGPGLVLAGIVAALTSCPAGDSNKPASLDNLAGSATNAMTATEKREYTPKEAYFAMWERVIDLVEENNESELKKYMTKQYCEMWGKFIKKDRTGALSEIRRGIEKRKDRFKMEKFPDELVKPDPGRNETGFVLYEKSS